MWSDHCLEVDRCSSLLASSQERVSVVQMGDDQHLDQGLRLVICEEKPDPADVIEGKSAGSAIAVMYGVQDSPSLRVTPRFPVVDEGNTVTSSTVTDR